MILSHLQSLSDPFPAEKTTFQCNECDNKVTTAAVKAFYQLAQGEQIREGTYCFLDDCSGKLVQYQKATAALKEIKVKDTTFIAGEALQLGPVVSDALTKVIQSSSIFLRSLSVVELQCFNIFLGLQKVNPPSKFLKKISNTFLRGILIKKYLKKSSFAFKEKATILRLKNASTELQELSKTAKESHTSWYVDVIGNIETLKVFLGKEGDQEFSFTSIQDLPTTHFLEKTSRNKPSPSISELLEFFYMLFVNTKDVILAPDNTQDLCMVYVDKLRTEFDSKQYKVDAKTQESISRMREIMGTEMTKEKRALTSVLIRDEKQKKSFLYARQKCCLAFLDHLNLLIDKHMTEDQCLGLEGKKN